MHKLLLLAALLLGAFLVLTHAPQFHSEGDMIRHGIGASQSPQAPSQSGDSQEGTEDRLIKQALANHGLQVTQLHVVHTSFSQVSAWLRVKDFEKCPVRATASTSGSQYKVDKILLPDGTQTTPTGLPDNPSPADIQAYGMRHPELIACTGSVSQPYPALPNN